MKSPPKPLLISFLLILTFTTMLFSITLELMVKQDSPSKLLIWFDLLDLKRQEQLITDICKTLNQDYSRNLQASAIFDNPQIRNKGMQITIKNLLQMQNSLNCLDYHYSQSFFKGKYYLKILLNADLLQSELLRRVATGMKARHQNWQDLVKRDGNLELLIKLPGTAHSATMKKQPGYHYFNITLQDLIHWGGVAEVQSEAFVMRVYFTVFLLLLVLAIFLYRAAKSCFAAR